MTTTFDRMVKAMQASPAWPAVFDAGSARVLLIAALREAREPSPEMLSSVLPHVGIHCDPKTTRLAERALFFLEPKDFPVESHRSGLDAVRCLIGDWRAGIDHILSEAEG